MAIEELLYKDLTYKLRGIFFKTYKELGRGLNENIYRNALVVELEKNKIAYKKEIEIPVFYENIKVGKQRIDLLVDERIILELKATPKLHHESIKQLLFYLKATDIKLGILVNFGDKLEIKRYIN
ncbi:GxxExxY protein [bacterium (Candidatus Howlettbacteria) CG_4_10_14_0_8_um_filter_40_9]|nr:MAG: GxxExxY protein [bacterium (Candidatus Howlettbacteria) CG_4_10_14_0_8_um_filter_40_9]